MIIMSLPEEQEVVSLLSAQIIALLIVLPFISISGFLWAYTALPLKFLDSNWPLWQLSLLFTLIYVPRVAAQVITRRVGDWVCVPLSALAAASNVILVLYPSSITAVWVAVSCTCSALNPTALRSLVHQRFHDSGEAQMKLALRIFTTADTLGYACAPFIGGILYDNGGLRACAHWAVFCTGTGALVPLLLSSYRSTFSKWWSKRRRVQDVKAAENKATDLGPGCKNRVSGVPVAPIVVVMLAIFANILTYGVEWCMYALYFRLRYGWSGTWLGFAQMVGDLVGAGVILLTSTSWVRNRCSSQSLKMPRLVVVLLICFSPPFILSTLCFCHSALMIMLAQPNFLVALLGQIFMGTVYVFLEQALQEMILFYAGGSRDAYRRLLSWHYIVFTFGCALSSPLAYSLYLTSGFGATFYATAGFIFVMGVGAAVFFICRLHPTAAGAENFAEAEAEIQKRCLDDQAPRSKPDQEKAATVPSLSGA